MNLFIIQRTRYAIIAADGAGEYPIITESRAGNDGVGVTVTHGTVAYVTTGGLIPDGADAVVQVEDTELLETKPKRVRILVKVNQGVDIRPMGCDISKDAVVLKADEQLGAAEIGLLATVGVLTVKEMTLRTPFVKVKDADNGKGIAKAFFDKIVGLKSEPQKYFM